MKRLLTIFTLCATTMIAASAVSGPAAADGRHDGRRHAGQADRQTSRAFTDRGEHRRAFRDNRDRRHHKFQRHHKRHRPAYGHAYGHRHGYRHVAPRIRHGYRSGSVFALKLDGGRIILRLD